MYNVNWHSEAHSTSKSKGTTLHLNWLTWHDPGYGNGTWKTEKENMWASFILSVMPIHIQLKFLYGLSTCDITTVTRILLSISQFQATEQKEYTHMLNKTCT